MEGGESEDEVKTLIPCHSTFLPSLTHWFGASSRVLLLVLKAIAVPRLCLERLHASAEVLP